MVSETNKSILIINTPENCSQCNQCWKKNVSKNKYMYFCGNKVFHQEKDAEEYSVDPEGAKPDWCPLSPLPSYRPINTDIQRGDTKSTTHLITIIHDIGFNECLDEILKGKE